MVEANPEEERINHTLRSSNLPFFEMVWTTAKLSTGIIAFSKRFYWTPPTRATKHAHDVQPPKPTARKLKQYSALVDIVSDNGAEWIKVSTITETRLLFELAKQGWEQASSSASDDDDCDSSSSLNNDHQPDSGSGSDSDDDAISILKTAESLSRASHATRIRYKHPRVHFVLPKIRPNHIPAIDALLLSITQTGATLTLAPTYPPLPPSLPAALPRLLVNPFAHFTPTLNIDCTILLALVSDLSHARVPAQSWFHRATRRQIEMEDAQNLLPALLYPAMGNRELVCTREAAVRMREIVGVIGTENERVRARLVLGEGEWRGRGGGAMVEGMRGVSEHEVPGEWRLPIRVVDAEDGRFVDDCGDDDDDDGVSAVAAVVEGEAIKVSAEGTSSTSTPLPRISTKVSALLTPINRSVFLYGWRSGYTTLTSNRTVVRQIESTVEEGREGAEDEDVEGPQVWLCGTSRSLVGKERGRRP